MNMTNVIYSPKVNIIANDFQVMVLVFTLNSLIVEIKLPIPTQSACYKAHNYNSGPH